MTATATRPPSTKTPLRAIVPTDSGLLIRKLDADERTANGLYLPKKQNDRDESTRAEIVAVGPGKLSPNWPERGHREPMEFQPGERIVYRMHAGTTVIHLGEELYIIDASEVVCKEAGA